MRYLAGYMSNEPDTKLDVSSQQVADAMQSAGQITGVVGEEAPLGARIVAQLIDWVVACVLSFVISFILGLISAKLGLLGGLAALGYFLLKDALPFLNGQSIGKKLMKIQAVTEDGKSLSGNWVPSLVRNGVLFIPFFVFVELFILATAKDKKLRRLGDQWAKTKVVVVAS